MIVSTNLLLIKVDKCENINSPIDFLTIPKMDYTMLKMRVTSKHQDSISDLSENYAAAAAATAAATNQQQTNASHSDCDHQQGPENASDQQKHYAIVDDVVIDKSDPSTCVRLSSTRVNETKIKLNFSVDRLLSSDCNRLPSISDHFSTTPNHQHQSPASIESASHTAFTCTLNCCNFDPVTLIGPHMLQHHMQQANGGGGGAGHKTIVRPMPMRIFNSNCKLQSPQSSKCISYKRH